MAYRNSKIFDAATMTGTTTITSTVVSLSNCTLWSMHVIFTGTPTGTFTWQVSNVNEDASFKDISAPTGAANPAGAGASFLVQAVDAGYEFVRLKYVNASGTGALTVHCCVKGGARG